MVLKASPKNVFMFDRVVYIMFVLFCDSLLSALRFFEENPILVLLKTS